MNPTDNGITETTEVAVAQSQDTDQRSAHLIAGIGASAGGLDAFKKFFSAMPSDSGIAFVLVQHLDPEYDSALAEILAELTEMPVKRATDGTVAQPNTVAVIPPNSILKIEKGVLRVVSPETVAARRSAIDIFLTSLAEDQAENAVAIILSGYGSDGTAGVAAVKERGGFTISEAEFDHQAKLGMPRSAASTGLVDRVLKIEEMPAALLELARFKATLPDFRSPEAQSDAAGELNTICAILNSRLGRDFSDYKANTLIRRVRRRMQVLRVQSVGEYIEQLRSRADEPELLFREFLIGVTRFFRDPSTFDALAATVVRTIVADHSVDGAPIRVWVCGCATGEEAYSLAILFKEELLRAESRANAVIFATDVDERAITFARAGLYTDAIEADLSTERLRKFFISEGARYRVSKTIRDMCVFSVHDLVKDPPFSKLDLVSCRNLLIYFGLRLQRRVIATFHYSLRPHGVLWFGPSEGMVSNARLFAVMDKRGRLFRRLDVASDMQLPAMRTRSVQSGDAHHAEADAVDSEIARIIAPHTPAHILVDRRLDIHKFSGPIAKFLEPAGGSAKLNVSRLLHRALRAPAGTLVRRAIESQRVAHDQFQVDVSGARIVIDLVAEPVAVPIAGELCALLVFRELGRVESSVAVANVVTDGETETQRELIAAREKLQTITEELATANEELQSSNEEFQSVNEELHSTVEELETSKEELQSINEELHTVNAELNSRAENLQRINSDLNNLFESTSIATLFLDRDMRIRRFTPAVTEIFNIREGDEERPITDFACRLARASIVDEARTVLHTLIPKEWEADSEDERNTYLVRIKPYRAANNVIDGTVITMLDISDRKRLEGDRAHLAAIVRYSEDAIISHDLEGRITSWNRGAERIFGYTDEEMIGEPMSKLLAEHQLDEWPTYLNRLRAGESISDLDVSRTTKNNRRIDVSLKISPVGNERGEIVGASAVARDISERKVAEERTNLLMAELDHRVKNLLAVVGSIVSQTLKVQQAPESIQREIEGRISAVARAQNLMTRSGGFEGSLQKLISAELAPYPNVSITADGGGDVWLCPQASVTLGLALHELATNAAKYGALSVPAGQTEVSWRVANVGDHMELAIRWIERGGPPSKPPTRRGFGSTLIERTLAHQLDAVVQRDFLESGLHCHIRIPLLPEVGRIEPAS